MTPDTSTLWIVAEVETHPAPETPNGSRSGSDIGGNFGPSRTDSFPTTTQKRVPVDAIALKAQMNGLLQIVSDLFDQAHHHSDRAHHPTDLQLQEIELTVEINAEGQVSLMGNGGKLANKGGITLKFTRPKPVVR